MLHYVKDEQWINFTDNHVIKMCYISISWSVRITLTEKIENIGFAVRGCTAWMNTRKGNMQSNFC